MSVRRSAVVLLASLATLAATGASASAAPGHDVEVSPQTIVAPDRAGYAVSPATVHRISAAWTVPDARCGTKTTYATFEVSVAGPSRPSRVGTALECHGGSAVVYGFVGGPGHGGRVDETVKPGDLIKVSIVVHKTFMSFSLEDDTQGWGVGEAVGGSQRLHFSTAAALVRARTSEAGQVLPVTRFTRVTFRACRVDGQPMGLEHPRRLVMHTPGGGLARPSGFTDGSRFTVIRPGV